MPRKRKTRAGSRATAAGGAGARRGTRAPSAKAKARARPGARKAGREAPPEREPGDEVLEIFRSYDRDGSGSIDRRELARLLEALGMAPSEEELAVALEVVDRNRSGKISWPEFQAWWRSR